MIRSLTSKQALKVTAAAVGILALVIIFVLMLRGYIEISPTIDIGNISIHFYSIFILLGIIVASLLISKYSKQFKQLKDVKVDEALLWVVIPGVIGARLWHVITDWHLYQANPIQALYVWNGGLAIHGAIAGGLLGLLLFCRFYKKPFFNIVEIVSVFIPLGQIIGRYGNFFNQELYGSRTSLPWGWYIFAKGDYFHPAFLYEQIANLILFLVLFKLFRKWGIDGSLRLPAVYVFGYGIIRFCVDYFRSDSPSAFLAAQILSIILVVMGGGYLLIYYLRHKQLLRK